MRVGAGAQADLAALAGPDRVLVLVEDLYVPARHRLAHRALPHLHEREVPAERIRLAETVEVEHRDPVLVAEPADRLRVERLTRGADPAEFLRVALARVLDRHHRADRRRRREDVGDAVSGEHLELLARIEASLALIDELDGAVAPRPDQGTDARRPGPFAHPVEELALAHLVAVDELLVGEDVAVGVEDALGESRGSRRVVDLGRDRRPPCRRSRSDRPARRATRRRARSPRRPDHPASDRRWQRR